MAASERTGSAATDLVAIVNTARRRHRSLFEILEELDRQPGILRLRPGPHRGGEPRRGPPAYVELANERPAGEVLYAFLRGTGLARAARGRRRRAAEEELANIARFFDIIRAQSSLLADDRAVFLARHLRR